MIIYMVCGVIVFLLALLWGALVEKVKPAQYNVQDWLWLMALGVSWPLTVLAVIRLLVLWLQSNPLDSE